MSVARRAAGENSIVKRRHADDVALFEPGGILRHDDETVGPDHREDHARALPVKRGYGKAALGRLELGPYEVHPAGLYLYVPSERCLESLSEKGSLSRHLHESRAHELLESHHWGSRVAGKAERWVA